MNKKCPSQFELPTLLSILHVKKPSEVCLPEGESKTSTTLQRCKTSQKTRTTASKKKSSNSKVVDQQLNSTKALRNTAILNESQNHNDENNNDGNNNDSHENNGSDEKNDNGSELIGIEERALGDQKTECNDVMADQLMKTVADRLGPNIWTRVRNRLNFSNWVDEDYAEKYRELLCEKFAEQARLKISSRRKTAAAKCNEVKEFKSKDPTKKWKMNCALRKKAFNEYGHDLFAALGDTKGEFDGSRKNFRLSFLRDFRTQLTPQLENEEHSNEGEANDHDCGRQGIPEEVADILALKDHEERDLMHERFIDKHRQHIQSAKAGKGNNKNTSLKLQRAKKPGMQPQIAQKLSAHILSQTPQEGPFRRRRMSLEQERECAVNDAELRLIDEELALVEEESD